MARTAAVRKRLPLDECQWRLAKLWGIAAAALAAILIVQSMLNKYGDSSGQAWKWLAAAVLPILTLIFGSLKEVAKKRSDRTTVDARFYRLSFWASVFYLAALFLVPLLQPIANTSPIAFLERSTVWLGMIQSVVVFPLGAYFVSSSGAPASDEGILKSGEPASAKG